LAGYTADINTKIATGDKRRTTMVAVTTTEEIPVLSEAEREELLKSPSASTGSCMRTWQKRRLLGATFL
jgi:hypothetical protein